VRWTAKDHRLPDSQADAGRTRRGNHYEFLSLSQELAAPGEMRQAQTFDFNFKNVEKQYESYSGINVKLRWGI
jgi:vacuolar protein sorting-associated protein 26